MRKLLTIALIFWSVGASAQLDSGYYLGASVGKMDYDDETFGGSISDSSDFVALYGGFRFDETWALEAHYGQSGDLSWRESALVPGTGTFSADVDASWKILEVRGLAHLKAFYGGVGYWDGDVEFDVLLTDPTNGQFSTSASTSDSGYSLIVGGEWEFDDWGVRAEYELFDTDSGVDLSLISIGGHFKF